MKHLSRTDFTAIISFSDPLNASFRDVIMIGIKPAPFDPSLLSGFVEVVKCVRNTSEMPHSIIDNFYLMHPCMLSSILRVQANA